MTDRDERARLQGLVAKAQQIQGDEPDVRAELTGWTGPRAGDGIPPASGGVRLAPWDEWAMRDFQASKRPPGMDYGSDPLVVVLCSFYNRPLAEPQAGQALQRVLLTAIILGLSASFIPRPTA
ncbi:hypothetical protein AB0K14_40470 [Actinosynnema sp. NPDC050801]|uniref:hypothetical protein n=1 Tax=unclassified Actinosynnema TaxID=2637065 RepID=UPI0033F15FEA